MSIWKTGNFQSWIITDGGVVYYIKTWCSESQSPFPGSQTENEKRQNNIIKRDYKCLKLLVINCYNPSNIFARTRLL